MSERYKPNVELMKEASVHLLGTHDFTSFCAAKTNVKDLVRTVHSIQFEVKNEMNQLHMEISGNGFLYNMVRIIAGTLWEIGIGKKSVDDVKRNLAILQSKKCWENRASTRFVLGKSRLFDN